MFSLQRETRPFRGGVENAKPLRRELVEIARFNGMSDAETLRDVLLAAMSDQCP
jgi:hypothetical protein